MESDYETYNLDEEEDATASFEKATQCPICHKVGDFDMLYSCFYEESAYSIHLCHFCDSVFFTIYRDYAGVFQIQYQYPKEVENSSMPIYIEQLSPQFLNIYQQALKAEEYNLDQIAGMGFRKALEFLVKDYSISKTPSDADKIKEMPLNSCIEKYIDHHKIKALAKRAAWLGNDHSHYLKKHSGRDLQDLKTLISLATQWINLEIESETYEREIEFKK
ncbi:DUF4145 domain-containing protein [Agathobaculum massiliense]|uniref:DUF4145 domain-containing protein n=1 Tax=Agathobaculum massiliense TaxID=3014267 RepID=UPI0036F27687